MDEEEILSAWVLDHLVDVLRLASAAMELVDVPEGATLDQLQGIMTIWQRLEVSTVMLLVQAGLSWEAMAARSGVTRQSLNRRLYQKVKARETTARKTEGPGLQTEWNRLLELVSGRSQELAEAGPTSTSNEIAQALLMQRGKGFWPPAR